MKNIEKLARYLGTKRNPDQILEFLIQLPLDQFGTPEFFQFQMRLRRCPAVFKSNNRAPGSLGAAPGG